ncbi:hypothetical protein ATANTOWER_002256 [Ataeniobius toweri]|uniref:Uncharacterized protein n=1 Tax=Ataeniobius toweri TaxID=208326 RepID=A0ABU7AM69_9TELE|nr:hypothetical protein [Ataeniobius toweri]
MPCTLRSHFSIYTRAKRTLKELQRFTAQARETVNRTGSSCASTVFERVVKRTAIVERKSYKVQFATSQVGAGGDKTNMWKMVLLDATKKDLFGLHCVGQKIILQVILNAWVVLDRGQQGPLPL